MDRIFRAADLCDADAFDAALSQWLPTAGAPETGARIVLDRQSRRPMSGCIGAVEAGGRQRRG